MSHGFQVQIINHEDVAESLSRESSKEPYANTLFVAQHLQFSDDEVRPHLNFCTRFIPCSRFQSVGGDVHYIFL